ncbi:MFS transporter [Solirubrobacter phytolaccae]|uniref:MFS transporter n=1 Tax=Solirubrobacter phytolaccae TaxID=1404360 RepID=A0A9X3N5N6_9ACTN|nr:MFS transporter [Solirubrobacter phytolaccae]MDA0180173.1 MFS transporter [Solirubrobacter phytolaccae]
MHRARPFFAAHLQSSLGTGAGYVAILLLAYEVLGSAWGATAVLLADLAPAMFLGPLLGGLIDRTSRLGCAIAADVLGALAFAGLAFLPHSTASLVALALLAGLSTALLRPASCALLPALVTPDQLMRANGVFGAMREIGQLAGPALAAGVLLVAEPSALLALNALTFAVSALLLTRLRPTATTSADDQPERGTAALLRDRTTRTLFASSGAVMLVAGTTNVAELVLARDELGAGGSGFALLVTAFGCGMLAGTLTRPRYLLSIALLAAGLLGTAAAPNLPLAMLAFAVAGIGNGLFIVTVRHLVQTTVPERSHGRAFGLLDALDSWAFGAAILAGGALAASVGGRMTFAIAGTGATLVLIASLRPKEVKAWAASGN